MGSTPHLVTSYPPTSQKTSEKQKEGKEKERGTIGEGREVREEKKVQGTLRT
jgi:hypothetical protein